MIKENIQSAESSEDSAFFKARFESTIEQLKNKKISNQSEEFNEILQIWIETSQRKFRVYSMITTNVLSIENYNEDYQDEDITVFIQNVKELGEKGHSIVEDQELWGDFIEKIIDHIELVQHQRNVILDAIEKVGNIEKIVVRSVEELTQESEIAKADLRRLKKENRKSKEIFADLKKKSEKMQKDFIAILGIFAAILLASFGGLTVISNILKEMNTPLGKILILSSLSILAVLIIIFLLLNGISKLTGENLRNCSCKPGEVCKCSLYEKHPTLFVSAVALIAIFIFGVFELLIDFENLKTHTNDSILILLLILSIIVLIILAVTYHFTFSSKNNDRQKEHDH